MPFFYVFPVPTDWTLKPTIDLRERFERRIDKDFAESNSDNRGDLISRWRVGFDFAYREELTGKIVYQYSRSQFWTAAENGSEPERSDILQGFVEFPALDGKIRLGRQVLTKSSERLLGGSDWGATGRSYDMARWSGKNLDLFAGRLAVNSAASKDAIIAGADLISRYGETLFLYKHDKKAISHDDIYTFDHVWKQKRGKWTTEAEIALQSGRTGDQKLEAWAGGGRLSYEQSKQLKLFVDVSAASGGHRGETVLTFDQIYASNHNRYGVMDMQGWRNMKGLTLGANLKANSKLTLNFEFHNFGLLAADDAWYGDGGKPNKGFLDPTGSKGTDVGHEFDLVGSLSLNSSSTLEGGLGVFSPGKFINRFAGKGDRNQFWGYMQYRFKF